MRVHDVIGGAGVHLHVRDWGPESAPPIVFIHGWSQCHLCWRTQYESALADEFRLVALDCRGHGMSQAPLGAEAYCSSKLWGDDIRAVLDQLGLERPILVGWSYGGLVICDYLRTHGQSDIAGVNFVGAAVMLKPAAFGNLIGAGYLDHVPGAIADDLPTNIEAVRGLVHSFTAKPLPREDVEAALCSTMVVAPGVRAALVDRDIDNDDVLSTLTVPVLVTHGRQDVVVMPAMCEHILSKCQGAKASWYEETGHMPQMEDPARYNRELAQFAQQARSDTVLAPNSGAEEAPYHRPL